jgi:conjugal transfer mating pair stabilization protein TraG
MIDAQYMLPAQLGDAASAQTNLAMAQSLRSTSDSYKLMARIAESTMPKVRNAIEMVQYAIFPVFLLFVVLSGHQAGGVIKSYAASLFWIQLWAPLYAVMNFIITMYSRSQYTNGSAGSGLSIEQMSFLNTAIVSDQAIAGMLVISIPAIAAAIVKGGEVGLQSVAGLVAPPRDPEKIASALAMGNMQMGNASLNNVSHDTMKGSGGRHEPEPAAGHDQLSGTRRIRLQPLFRWRLRRQAGEKRCPRRHGTQRFPGCCGEGELRTLAAGNAAAIRGVR